MRFLPIVLLGLLTGCDCRTEVSIVSRPTVPEAAASAAASVEPVVETSPPVDAGCDTVCQLPTRTLVIGDSEAGFVSRRLREIKRPGETIDTDFKGGTTIQYWAEQGNFKRALSRHPKPDTVVIFLGTNNYWNKTCPNVHPILDEVVQQGIKCVWVGPTEVQGKKWPINQLIKQAVSSTCTYVDTETLSIPLEDGVHPTYPGILKWLRAVWSVL